MAAYTTLKTPARSLKMTTGYGSPSRVPVDVTLPAGSVVASADTVELFDVPQGYVVTDFKLQISATLGASCTARAQIGSRNLAAATTAGAAADVLQTVADIPGLATAARTFQLLIGGAAITSAATLKGYVEVAPAR